MRKINYYRMLLGGISLLGLANVVQAQCVTPPTCAQLGYTKTASECSGHTFLKCPFDMSVGYCDLGTSSTSSCEDLGYTATSCPDAEKIYCPTDSTKFKCSSSCADLGYTKSASECSGYTLIACPYNSDKYKCGTATTPSYSVGDSYAVNGAIIGKVIAVNGSTVTVASQPQSKTSPSLDGLRNYCENLTLGGGMWTAPSTKSQCGSILSIFTVSSDSAMPISDDESYCQKSGKSCSCSRSDIYWTYRVVYYSCIGEFSIK